MKRKEELKAQERFEDMFFQFKREEEKEDYKELYDDYFKDQKDLLYGEPIYFGEDMYLTKNGWIEIN